MVCSQQQKSTAKDSPRKKKLQSTIFKLRKDKKKLQQTVRRLRKQLEQQKMRTSAEEENDIIKIRKLGKKVFSGNFEKLLTAQIDALTKNKRGRRYDNDFKQFALSLFFSSPRNYKNLVNEFALPSIRSLQSFTQSWNIIPGINDKIFDALEFKLKSLASLDKHCILCLDEMSLKAHLFYNISRDEIIGFEDTGYNKLSKPAKSALVVMARSIAGNWKLPICYCFAETTCRSNVLKDLIFNIIIKLRNCGAIVHALVTDMGSNFIQLS